MYIRADHRRRDHADQEVISPSLRSSRRASPGRAQPSGQPAPSGRAGPSPAPADTSKEQTTLLPQGGNVRAPDNPRRYADQVPRVWRSIAPRHLRPAACQPPLAISFHCRPPSRKDQDRPMGACEGLLTRPWHDIFGASHPPQVRGIAPHRNFPLACIVSLSGGRPWGTGSVANRKLTFAQGQHYHILAILWGI